MSWGERTVEVPWFLSKVVVGPTLDVGSAESGYVNNLLELEAYPLVLNDIRTFSTHTNDDRVSCVVKDIRQFHSDIKFKNVLCISTLEHMALDAYDQKADWAESPFESQLVALDKMMKLVAKDGQLILTVPYGKYEHGGWVIVYNKQMIDKIKDCFEVVEETYFTLTDRDNDTWVECAEEDCPLKGMDHYNGHMRATSCACLILKS